MPNENKPKEDTTSTQESNGGEGTQQQQGQQAAQQQETQDPTAQILEMLAEMRKENEQLQTELKGVKDTFALQVARGAVIQDDSLVQPDEEKPDFQLTPYSELDFTIK